MTKCSFHKYGPSGTVEIKDGLCVLPLNIINEKMFIFIWFWLVLVSVISGVFLLYRLAVLLGPQIRVALITVKGGKSTKRSDVEAILDPEVRHENQNIRFLFYIVLILAGLLVELGF